MNLKLKPILKVTVPLLLSVVAVWYSFSIIPFDRLVGSFKEVNYSWVLLGTFFGLLSHLSRAYRWRFQLEPMGYSIKLGNSIMAVFATYLIKVMHIGFLESITYLSALFKVGTYIVSDQSKPFKMSFSENESNSKPSLNQKPHL